jgi:hypothetical protein
VISAAEGKDVLIKGGDGVQVDLLAIEPAIQAELKASVDSAALVADERERKSEYVYPAVPTRLLRLQNINHLYMYCRAQPDAVSHRM